MASKTFTVRVGADPEVFVANAKTKEIVPICGLVGGTKEKPVPFDKLNSGKGLDGRYAYQEDGCAFEFNIPAGHNYEYTALYLRNAWDESTKLLATKGLVPQIAPFYDFKPEQLTDARARAIGCSPDLDAYGREDGPVIRPALDITDFGSVRFAGGHLHLSYDKTKVPPYVMARYMDALLGLPCLGLDKQGVRRQFYGRPGLFRDKPYGIEYRSLSNFWLQYLKNEASLLPLYYILGTAFDLGYIASSKPDVLHTAYRTIPWDDVRDSINQENTGLAKEIWTYIDQVSKVPTRFGKSLWNYAKDPRAA